MTNTVINDALNLVIFIVGSYYKFTYFKMTLSYYTYSYARIHTVTYMYTHLYEQ